LILPLALFVCIDLKKSKTGENIYNFSCNVDPKSLRTRQAMIVKEFSNNFFLVRKFKQVKKNAFKFEEPKSNLNFDKSSSREISTWQNLKTISKFQIDFKG
jgi:hypothetical protein